MQIKENAMSKKPTVLMILDGFGLNERHEANAVYQANTPVIDSLMRDYPFVKGYASGLAVGLPDGQMGNSEVGHLNMGAGRIVYQELTRITKEIEDGDFFENEALKAAMKNARDNDSSIHFMGLLSDGGVHSHNTHLYGLLEMAKREGLKKVYVHCFLDGRDTPPASGKGFIEELQAKMKEIGVGEIGVVSGRYYAMDRDNRWERVNLAYDALTKGEGVKGTDAAEAVQASYDEGVTDEFVKPIVSCPEGIINQGDSVVFMNFRPDRAREMTWALNLPDFEGFERKKTVYPLSYVCTAQYDENLTLPIAYPPEEIDNTLGDLISAHGLKQFRVAETEKYAHVTFFFNGGVEKQTAGEDRCLVPSPKEYATYDLIPQMSAEKVCDKVIEALRSEQYDMIVCNFANCDMVGHTGIMDAAVKAVETVDECMGRIAAEVEKHSDTVLLVTADHGNADCMFDENGKVNTAHTTNPVPFLVTRENASLEDGRLADIAPTILQIMGLDQPAEMTGRSVLHE